jgi:ATP-dependent DNA helicase RecG
LWNITDVIDSTWLQATVATLRANGTDSQAVEAKSAAGGMPATIASTLSAFGNSPGGGTVIFGLDERKNFSVVAIDAPALSAAIASIARQALTPPVTVEMNEVEFEGSRLLVVRVVELPLSAKPCVVKRSGRAYLRSGDGDGDFELSDLEIQGILVNRTQPRFDSDPVATARRTDLDPDLVARYLATARATDRGLARITNDETLLLKTGVLADPHTPTVAGLLALGEYPQQWFPNYVIQAAVRPDRNAPPNTRVADIARFSGPIPQMIDDALVWIAGHSRHRIVDSPAGRVRDQYDFPPVAARELLSNALVHRDLAEWSWSRAIELRIDDRELRLTNPGGLYGLTVARLFTNQLTSARNLSLTRICQYVTLRDGRVVEALASGMPKILEATVGDGLPVPRFFDQGISFTAILQRPGTARPTRTSRGNLAHKSLTVSEQRVLDAVSSSGLAADELAAKVGLSTAALLRHIRSLRAKGLVVMDGGVGQLTTTYRRAD